MCVRFNGSDNQGDEIWQNCQQINDVKKALRRKNIVNEDYHQSIA